MKRISCRIASVFDGLFTDFKTWGYGNPKEHERDHSRIVTLLNTRGERSILLDFPSYAKLFDFAISRGQLRRGMFPLLGRADGYYPPFMRSHFERVFDRDGLLLKEVDAGAVFNIRQVLRCFQKVEIPCEERLVEKSVKAFFKTDGALRAVSPAWYDGSFTRTVHLADATDWGSDDYLPGVIRDPVQINRQLVTLSQRVADFLVSLAPDLDPRTIIGNHGPGAVADAKYGDDKYVFPTWPERLSSLFPRDEHVAANVGLLPMTEQDYGYHDYNGRELPAKLIPVPKNQEKPRLIASEPTGNQFIQGGINKFLRGWVASSDFRRSIFFDDQTVSQWRALVASKTSSLATVDLRDASDRLSCWTVERIFRRKPSILAALAASRSAYLVDRKYGNGFIELHKYAPQGNATVFPLQSITYTILALAAVVYSGPDKVATTRDLAKALQSAFDLVTVFGDDIIIPSRALPYLSSLLELCQLEVNGAKSHFSGNFAESCGCDAFRGVDVTPAYVRAIDDKASPGDVASFVEVSNNFWKRGLFSTSRIIESWVPEEFLRDIPISNTESTPISLYTFSPGTAARRVRYNSSLYREECMALVLQTSGGRVRREEWQSLLQYFIEGPHKDAWEITPKWRNGVNRNVRQRLRRAWVSLD